MRKWELRRILEPKMIMNERLSMDLEAYTKELIEAHEKHSSEASNPVMETRDNAYRAYLESVLERLTQGEDEQAITAWLEQEESRLDGEIAREEACATFDWYDDHYYEKIYLGQRDACKNLLAFRDAVAE